nr:dihydropteroate synthase [Fulvivirga sedimenti]
MGILNITPDSFSDGGELDSSDALLLRAEEMLNAGASILDIGGYSTRPGADDISENTELERVIPVIQMLRETFPDALLSIDTFRSRVAAEAVTAGANMVNDISGGSLDQDMFSTIAALDVPYVLMHMKGTPQTMKNEAHYENMLTEMLEYFRKKLEQLAGLGVTEIILDPGFGFAKNIDQNYYLLKNMSYFKSLGLPLLTGISRKSLIFKLLNIEPRDAVNGTSVLNTYALMEGASLLRVHDVKAAMECIKLTEKIKNTVLA